MASVAGTLDTSDMDWSPTTHTDVIFQDQSPWTRGLRRKFDEFSDGTEPLGRNEEPTSQFYITQSLPYYLAYCSYGNDSNMGIIPRYARRTALSICGILLYTAAYAVGCPIEYAATCIKRRLVSSTQAQATADQGRETTPRRRKYKNIYLTPRQAYLQRSARSIKIRDIPGRFPGTPLQSYNSPPSKDGEVLPITEFPSNSTPSSAILALSSRFPDSPLVAKVERRSVRTKAGNEKAEANTTEKSGEGYSGILQESEHQGAQDGQITQSNALKKAIQEYNDSDLLPPWHEVSEIEEKEPYDPAKDPALAIAPGVRIYGENNSVDKAQNKTSQKTENAAHKGATSMNVVELKEEPKPILTEFSTTRRKPVQLDWAGRPVISPVPKEDPAILPKKCYTNRAWALAHNAPVVVLEGEEAVREAAKAAARSANLHRSASATGEFFADEMDMTSAAGVEASTTETGPIQGVQQRSALARIEPNQVSITRPSAGSVSSPSKPTTPTAKPRPALVKREGPAPIADPLGIVKFIRNFRLGKPPPPPLVTKHFAKSARKSVGFYESPKTGGPVTRTKRYVIGEAIDHPSPTSTYDDASMMSSHSPETQFRHQSLIDAQLQSYSASETRLSSSTSKGGEISVDSMQESDCDTGPANHDNTSQYQETPDDTGPSSFSLVDGEHSGDSANASDNPGDNSLAAGTANNTGAHSAGETLSDGNVGPSDNNTQPRNSPSRSGSSSSNLNKVVDGDLSSRMANKQESNANDASDGECVVQSIESDDADYDSSEPYKKAKPKRGGLLDKWWGLSNGRPRKRSSTETFAWEFGELALAPETYAGIAPRRVSQRQQEQQRREAKEKAAREKKAAEEKAQREKAEAELRAQVEREAEEQRKKLGVRRFTKEPIIQPLSQYWDNKVDEIMAQAPSTAELLRINKAPLSRSDFGTVLPQGGRDRNLAWLNDSVISAYLEAVVNMAHERIGRKRNGDVKYHAFSPFFFKNLNDPKKGYSSVSRWVSRAGIAGKKLLNVEYVFIPVNEKGNHWTLATISPIRRTIEYWDSMGGDARNPVTCVKRFLKGELGALYKEEEWTVKGEDDTNGLVYDGRGKGPQQGNAKDCGVFAITSAKMIALGVDPMAVTQADMPLQRRRIVAEMMNGGFAGEMEVGFEFV